MEIIEVERLANQVGMPVIRNPERNFPGVLVQGDTLALLYHMTHLIHTSLPEDHQFRGISHGVVRTLADFVIEYETVLKAHNIDLPYADSLTSSLWE